MIIAYSDGFVHDHILQSSLNEMGVEHLYYYYMNMGSLKALNKEYKNALEFYNQALRLSEQPQNDFLLKNNEHLYYSMSLCYSSLEVPTNAIVFLNKTSKAHVDGAVNRYNIGLTLMLVLNYIKAGVIGEAEKLLNQCLVRAKGIGNDLFVGLVHMNFGALYRKLEHWEKAIEYFDHALCIFESGSENYFWATYYKIYCSIQNRDMLKAEDILTQARTLHNMCKTNLIPIESLEHMFTISKRMTIFNYESVKYIETVTIPYFMNNYSKFHAISYYRLLEQHYARARKNRESLLMAREIREIYGSMFTDYEERREQ